MLRLTIFIAFLLCAEGAVLPPLGGRIVGGSPADITEAPYQVALLIDYYGTGSFSLICGGSIISPTVIVTAAHCTDDNRNKPYKVRAGSSAHGSGGQVVDVARITNHPSYDTNTIDSDISILHLAAPLILGAGVATIPLPSQDSHVPDGASALVTGWGLLHEDGDNPELLKKLMIPIVNQQTCVDMYSDFVVVTDNMICAGLLGVTGSVCQNDSGGPLAVGGVLVGVTSWGKSCGDPRYPAVWTRVAAFRHWIDANM